MIIKFKYYPLRAKIAAVTTVLAVFFLIYPVFFVRAVADRDPEIELALAIVDTDSRATLRVLEHYAPRDSDNAARVAALRSFARFLEGYDDTARSMLDTAAIITLRRNGLYDYPILARALLAYGMMASNRGEYQTAVNALGESADRALSLLADTLLAARAYRNLGYVYEEISAFDPAAYNISYAQNLFDALGDTTRTDLCRGSLAFVLGMSFNRKKIEEAVAILDSMRPRMEANLDYAKYLSYTYTNIQPRLRVGDYEQAIEYGLRHLSESQCSRKDSLWVYALMTRGAIASQKFTEARQWLDSARQFQDLISRKNGGMRISLAGIELALIDSLDPDPHIKALRKTFDTENDSLFALFKSNIALMRPSYTLEAGSDIPADKRNTTIIAIFCIIAISAAAWFIFVSKISSLQVRIAMLKNDYDSISRSASSLADKIASAEAETNVLNSQLQETRIANDDMALQLRDYQMKLSESHKLVHSLSQTLHVTEQAALSEKKHLTEQIKYLTEKLHEVSAATISPQGRKYAVAPYLSAIDTIITSAFPYSQQPTLNSTPSNKKIAKLMDYLQSDRFAESLLDSINTFEPLFISYNSELQSLLSREQYFILLMIMCGFSVQTISVVSGVSRTSLYRRREAIENRLLATGHEYLQYLAEKYIRHYK